MEAVQTPLPYCHNQLSLPLLRNQPYQPLHTLRKLYYLQFHDGNMSHNLQSMDRSEFVCHYIQQVAVG